MSEEKEINDAETQKKEAKKTTSESAKKPKSSKKSSALDEYKRRYFDFYEEKVPEKLQRTGLKFC